MAIFEDENEYGRSCCLAVGGRGYVGEKEIAPNRSGHTCNVVYKPKARVNEIMKDTLQECLQCTIRWPQRLVRGTSPFAANNAAEAIQVYNSTEEHADIYTPTERPSNLSTGMEGPPGQRSVVGNNSISVPSFECPFSDGLPQSLARQPYATNHHRVGTCRESRDNKITLASVRATVSR